MMKNITIIEIPDLNDCFQSVTIDRKRYLLRTTWNDTAKRWSFGLYTMQKEPIAVGLRMIPRFPINIQIVDETFPAGVFGVYSDLEYIGRDDFKNGTAEFAYIPEGEQG